MKALQNRSDNLRVKNNDTIFNRTIVAPKAIINPEE